MRPMYGCAENFWESLTTPMATFLENYQWAFVRMDPLNALELITRRHAGSGVFCGQLQTVTEDIFIFAVLVCSAH